MDSTNDDGSRRDRRCMRVPSTQPQTAFREDGLSYFDQNNMHGHGSAHLTDAHKSVPQSHQRRKPIETGSPLPYSATTSGSTSTPTSPISGGLPVSGDGQKHSESASGFPSRSLSDGASSSHIPHVNHEPQVIGHWPVSNDLVSQQSSTSPAPVTPLKEEQNLVQSPGTPYNPSAYPSAIKLLVSNNMAGSIIGRAGQTISELQAQSSARLKLSQSGDFYPGTQDRVCLVQGQLENVKLAVRLLLERFYMLQQQQHTQHLNWQPKQTEGAPVGFDFVVRLLVPSSSCGMMIGKAGSNIKHMEEASGVSSVRLSPKETADSASPTATVVSGTSERIVTVTGPTIDSCFTCICIVLDNMMANHDICRYSNMTTSYSRMTMQSTFGAAPHVPIPGRPLLVVPSGVAESPMWEGSAPYSQFGLPKRSISSPDIAGQVQWDQQVPSRMPSGTSTGSMGRPQHPSFPQYNPVFAEAPHSYTSEIPPVMPSPARGPQAGANTPPVYLLPPMHPNHLDQGSISNSLSAPDLLALQLQDSMRMNSLPNGGTMEYTHFVPQLPQPTPPGFTAQVVVSDTLIGSILGRGGRTLNELQMHSNTRIRISQRGEYVRGTRNRVVTIRGPTAHSVSLAQYLMSQRMVHPPTTTYSTQLPFHSPPIQQPSPSLHQSHPLHQSQLPHQAHRHDIQAPTYHDSPIDSPFQGHEPTLGHPPPSGNSLPGASSGKEITHS